MRDYTDISLDGRISTSRKYLLVILVIALVICSGILVAFLVKKNKEFHRNNFGVFDISISDGVSHISNDGKASVEYTKLKIGQRESLKFGFKLSSYSRSPSYEEGEQVFSSDGQGGVYVRLVIDGEVYDINEDGTRQRNEEYCKKLTNVILYSCYASAWDQHNNQFVYCSTKNRDDVMRVGSGEEYFSNGDIVIYFNSNIVDASWWEKVVVLNFQLEVIDCLSEQATDWKG